MSKFWEVMRIKNWIPAIIWILVIFCFSTDNFSSENTGSILEKIFGGLLNYIHHDAIPMFHLLVRKMAHLTEYFILAVLTYAGCRSRRLPRWNWRWVLTTMIIVGVCALLDEFHQSFVPSRTASLQDSLLDISGGLCGLGFIFILAFMKGFLQPDEELPVQAKAVRSE